MIFRPLTISATFYFLVAVSQSQVCNKPVAANNNGNNGVTKISYASSGGRSGNYESLALSADSVVYIQAHRGAEKAFREKTKADEWNSLTKAINLGDFDKIQSNPGHALYDGIDVTIAIETGTKMHSFVNGN